MPDYVRTERLAGRNAVRGAPARSAEEQGLFGSEEDTKDSEA